MPRPPRLHFPGATYHVTLRGNHRQDIFFCATDRARMSELLADVLSSCDARLHGYCYMSNHLHAIIQVSDVPLGPIVQRIASPYARMTQARLDTTGHLFEKRYYPVLVDTDAYLLELLRYVHLNPVRARIVLDPSTYPWSSHHAYLGNRIEPWVTTDFALSLFNADRQRAIDAYRRFVAEAVRADRVRSPLEDVNPHDARILGGDDFARRMFGPDWGPKSRKSLDQLVSEACVHFGLTTEELKSASLVARIVAARAWITHEAVTGGIASISAVGRHLGRDESSLRRALRKRFEAA